MTGNVLAIDQGTSGTKAVVLAPGDRVLASVHVPLRAVHGPDGSVEQDPAALLDSVLTAGRAALDSAGEPVTAVGLANQGETVLAWDPHSGAPLSPLVVWQDRRATGVCAALAAHAGELRRISGLTLDPYFAAPKMAWLRSNMTGDGVVTTSDAWLVHALTGTALTDASTASRTMLLDLAGTDWSPRAAAVFDLPTQFMPAVVDCSGRFGETTAFGAALPLTGLVVDQQAALFADGCLAAGQAKCTYGTGAFLLVNAGPGVPGTATALTPSVAWRLAGAATYCLDGQVFTAGSAVRWLVDLGIIDRVEDLDAVAAQVPDGGGVRFVPALAGLGAPWGRPDALASLTGLSLGTGPGHLARALVEGIAAQVAVMADAVAADLGEPLTTLRVDGGLTRSEQLMQTQADLLQTPVEVCAGQHATALGAAAFARIGAEPVLTAQQAVGPWRPLRIYEPRIDAGQAAERRSAFVDAVAQVLQAVTP